MYFVQSMHENNNMEGDHQYHQEGVRKLHCYYKKGFCQIPSLSDLSHQFPCFYYLHLK